MHVTAVPHAGWAGDLVPLASPLGVSRGPLICTRGPPAFVILLLGSSDESTRYESSL